MVLNKRTCLSADRRQTKKSASEIREHALFLLLFVHLLLKPVGNYVFNNSKRYYLLT